MSGIIDHPGLVHIDRLLSGGAPTPHALDLLSGLGVHDATRTLRSLQSLALHPSFPRGDRRFLAQFLDALGETFEPERALTNLERIIETREDPEAFLVSLRRSRQRQTIVLTLAGGSQFLSDTVLRHPEFLDWLLRPSTLRRQPPKKRLFTELWRWVHDASEEPDGPKNALRRFRHREYLRIGLRDLLRRADVVETTRALADLADVCIEAAVRVARVGLEEAHGKPRYKTREGRRRACEFLVVGMGKLGGRELNFSSDIDLIFVYSSDEGGTTGARDPGGGPRRRQVTNHEFHARLAQRLIALLTETTEEGHVFRVDTRLRPEGSQGALVYSLRSCEVYYESYGETWERQALIKARPVAGSPALGEAFMQAVRPFIFRRTLDLSALDEIARIKDRINSRLVADGPRKVNVKLGEGGIREIEFIVQAYQLIYGGKEPLLRTANSIEAIDAVRTHGLLPIDECDRLAEAYRFLRDVEHRIQVTHGIQTHELPGDAHGLAVLARKMGFRHHQGKSERDTFLAALGEHQAQVARIFTGLFRKEDTAPSIHGAGHEEPVAAETLEDSLSPGDLAPYNFADPKSASGHLRLLRNGEPFQHVSSRAKRLFDDLLPRLLPYTLVLPDPDRAVANLVRFVDQGGGREAVLALMAEHETAFKILLRLFGSSDYLSEILLAQPGLLDGMLRPEMFLRSKTVEELTEEFAEVRGASSLDDRFYRLGEAKRGEELAIGIRSILEEADILETLADLTRLAEAVVATGLAIAEEETAAEYGVPFEDATGEQARFAVIGLGKLGSRDINFGSDLDLVFVYSGGGTTRPGPAPSARSGVPNHEYFLKVASTLRDGLVAPKSGERAYEVDLRLRPEGQKGSIAAPLYVIRAYFEGRAALWERQALCRARPVAGAADLGRAFMELAHRFVYETEVPGDLAAQVNHMRGRLEHELAQEAEGKIDIKLGHGGTADIDFLVQYLQIAHGGSVPALRRPDTYGALETLRETGLLGAEDAHRLCEAYRFLRLVENRLRIARSEPIHTFPQTPEGMEMVARRVGYADDDEGSARAKLLADYEEMTQDVRTIYRRVVG